MYNLYQAYELLKQGKKIKSIKWDCYYYIDSGNICVRNPRDHYSSTSYDSINDFFNHYNHDLFCPNEPNWEEYKEETNSTADLTSNESELYSKEQEDDPKKGDLTFPDEEIPKMNKVSITINFDSLEEANSFMAKGADDNHKSKADMMRCFANHVKNMNAYNDSAYKLLKISLIKLARDMFDLGLKEAKDLVEEAAVGRY